MIILKVLVGLVVLVLIILVIILLGKIYSKLLHWYRKTCIYNFFKKVKFINIVLYTGWVILAILIIIGILIKAYDIGNYIL